MPITPPGGHAAWEKQQKKMARQGKRGGKSSGEFLIPFIVLLVVVAVIGFIWNVISPISVIKNYPRLSDGLKVWYLGLVVLPILSVALLAARKWSKTILAGFFLIIWGGCIWVEYMRGTVSVWVLLMGIAVIIYGFVLVWKGSGERPESETEKLVLDWFANAVEQEVKRQQSEDPLGIKKPGEHYDN